MGTGLTALVVDDSAFARSMISKRLNADLAFTRIEIARDGQEALKRIKEINPDVVTMDVQMPGLDGLGALERIMEEQPTPVVMLSSLTGDDTDTTLKALELGAVDFFLKPKLSESSNTGTDRDLAETVKMAARVPVARLANAMRRNPMRQRTPSAPGNAVPKRVRRANSFKRLVMIASSTGGPRALAEVVPDLPADENTAYLLVQHMPAGFTKSLSDRLNTSSALTVREAVDGDHIEAGTALMAPGGFHMDVTKDGEIKLLKTSAMHGVRPAADITMNAVAKIYGAMVVGVVLTGMGSDGRDGAGNIKSKGGKVIAEDESTCAVFGMPRAVIDAGHASVVAPIGQVASEIVKMVGDSSSSGAGAA